MVALDGAKLVISDLVASIVGDDEIAIIALLGVEEFPSMQEPSNPPERIFRAGYFYTALLPLA